MPVAAVAMEPPFDLACSITSPPAWLTRFMASSTRPDFAPPMFEVVFVPSADPDAWIVSKPSIDVPAKLKRCTKVPIFLSVRDAIHPYADCFCVDEKICACAPQGAASDSSISSQQKIQTDMSAAAGSASLIQNCDPYRAATATEHTQEGAIMECGARSHPNPGISRVSPSSAFISNFAASSSTAETAGSSRMKSAWRGGGTVRPSSRR